MRYSIPHTIPGHIKHSSLSQDMHDHSSIIFTHARHTYHHKDSMTTHTLTPWCSQVDFSVAACVPTPTPFLDYLDAQVDTNYLFITDQKQQDTVAEVKDRANTAVSGGGSGDAVCAAASIASQCGFLSVWLYLCCSSVYLFVLVVVCTCVPV